MTDARCRIAVSGTGRIGRAHIERIVANPRCELVATADPIVPALSHLPGVRHFDGLAPLLSTVQPDGVIIATPNQQHRHDVELCVATGVIPLIEKPLAGSLADAEAIVKAVRTAGLRSLVGHHRRHSALLRSVKARVASGTIGKVVGFNGLAAFAKPASYFDEAWRREPGGGPVLINLIHEVDTMRFLLGEIREVVGLTAHDTRQFPVEDSAAVAIRFASGALGTFLLSDCAASPWGWEQTSGENPSYHRYADEACYNIIGTRGSLTVPDGKLFMATDEPSWFEGLSTGRCEQPGNDPLTAQLDHFIDVITGTAESAVDTAEALVTFRATLAVLEAAATGRLVKLQ